MLTRQPPRVGEGEPRPLDLTALEPRRGDTGIELPDPHGRGRVRRSYVLCSTPRSGSTLLSEAIADVGGLGNPLEYFDPTDVMAQLVRRWRCSSIAAYVDALHRHGVGPEGVFGARLHWFHLGDLTATYHRGTVPDAGLALGVVRRVCPESRFVHVTRRDRDRQAVSWSNALQTDCWTSREQGDDAPDPVYDADLIDHCRRRIDAEDQWWRRLFARAGVRPLTVVYEDLTARYPEVVASVARWLGVDVAPADVVPPRLRRQADERSEEMVARYRAERGPRSADYGR